MGSLLRIGRVRLQHATPDHSWQFPDGVTIIVGASGGGKTSLLNLIQFGLGMGPSIIEEVMQAFQRRHP